MVLAVEDRELVAQADELDERPSEERSSSIHKW